MTHRTAPLLMALAGAILFCGGMVFWLAQGLMSSASSSAQNPSLMEILDDVRRGHPAPPGSQKPAPQPGGAPPPPPRPHPSRPPTRPGALP
jgi:hypothetical protein